MRAGDGRAQGVQAGGRRRGARRRAELRAADRARPGVAAELLDAAVQPARHERARARSSRSTCSGASCRTCSRSRSCRATTRSRSRSCPTTAGWTSGCSATTTPCPTSRRSATMVDDSLQELLVAAKKRRASNGQGGRSRGREPARPRRSRRRRRRPRRRGVATRQRRAVPSVSSPTGADRPSAAAVPPWQRPPIATPSGRSSGRPGSASASAPRAAATVSRPLPDERATAPAHADRPSRQTLAGRRGAAGCAAERIPPPDSGSITAWHVAARDDRRAQAAMCSAPLRRRASRPMRERPAESRRDLRRARSAPQRDLGGTPRRSAPSTLARSDGGADCPAGPAPSSARPARRRVEARPDRAAVAALKLCTVADFAPHRPARPGR